MIFPQTSHFDDLQKQKGKRLPCGVFPLDILFVLKARDGARGPGDLGFAPTGAKRRHRTSSPGLGSKTKKDIQLDILFCSESARRGSNPRPPPWQGGAPPLSHSRISYGQVIIYYRAPEMSIKKVCIFFVNCIYN